MTLKLNHLHIKTRDPEKTAKFYVDTLGAKILNQSPRGGYRLDLHGLSLNVTKFLDDQKREQKYGMEHIAIDTDELDALLITHHRVPVLPSACLLPPFDFRLSSSGRFGVNCLLSVATSRRRIP